MPVVRFPEEREAFRAFVASRTDPARRGAARGDHDLNPGMRSEAPEDLPEELIAAAVLVPLVMRHDGVTMLLTKRTDHLRDHAGQVSFPGGRVEAHDEGAVATALRETEEEIGIGASHIEVVGELDLYETRTGFRITPVVGLVEPGFTLTLDEFEVAEVFEVPLSFVLDPANLQKRSLVWRGAERHFYMLPYGGREIWGATAGMIVNLYNRLSGSRPTE
ncbi:MAG: CoA pyrophosphatase [Proteobacteria bacterium]|nr:CoA pyrophosphatase [Pseudomonadota bacterium]